MALALLPLTDSIVTETASPMLTATGICDGDDPCNDPDLTPVVTPTVPASFIAEVTLDGQAVVGHDP